MDSFIYLKDKALHLFVEFLIEHCYLNKEKEYFDLNFFCIYILKPYTNFTYILIKGVYLISVKDNLNSFKIKNKFISIFLRI